MGKTTTAITLGHGLAIQGRRVMLIDLDPQGQVASALGKTPAQAIYDWLASDRPLGDVVCGTGRKNLYMIPGNGRTSSAQALLNFEGRTLRTIRDKMHKIGGVEFVIVDTAPSIGGLQEAALLAADLVIIPTATNYLSSEGVVRTFATLNVLREEHRWRGTVFGVLPTFYDSTTLESAATVADLNKAYKKLVLPVIHRATIIERCAGEGKTIWEMARDHRAALEYAELVWRVRDAQA